MGIPAEARLDGSCKLATIREVARAAGVSTATVSRVFSNSPLVSPETAQRVMDHAARLDYWPNSAARSLSTRCNQTFGVMLPDLFGEFYSDLMRGLDREAGLHGYKILLSSSHSNSNDVLAASRVMLGRIDGLILLAPDEESIETVERVRRRLPVVLLNPRAPVAGCHSVGIANYAGARLAVQHLLDLGHRRLAFIAGPEGNGDAEERLRGFRDALGEGGLDPDQALVLPGDFREMTGMEACAPILEAAVRPTAVFAANDSMAIGLLRALHGAGLQVPRDMAVVGFDNVAMAGFLNPSLTTIHVDACGLGRQAVQLMLQAIEGDDDAPSIQTVIPTTLKIRESCGDQSGTSLDVQDRPDREASTG